MTAQIHSSMKTIKMDVRKRNNIDKKIWYEWNSHTAIQNIFQRSLLISHIIRKNKFSTQRISLNEVTVNFVVLKGKVCIVSYKICIMFTLWYRIFFMGGPVFFFWLSLWLLGHGLIICPPPPCMLIYFFLQSILNKLACMFDNIDNIFLYYKNICWQ